MKKIITICVLVFGILNSSSLIASHIVGGDMAYECLGNNQYKITLKVYRDCASSSMGGGLTPFDAAAAITIFRVTGINPATGQVTYALDQTFSVTKGAESVIPADLSNPCLTPPANICVDQAIYEETITLSFKPLGYVIAY